MKLQIKLGTYFTFYNKKISHYPKIKLCAIDNVLPTSESIGSREYPLVVTGVFIVTLKGMSKESVAGKLRDWLLSPQGQKVVDESGYVPINLKRRRTMKSSHKKIMIWCIIGALIIIIFIAIPKFIAYRYRGYNSSLISELTNPYTETGSEFTSWTVQFKGSWYGHMFSVQNYPRTDGSTSAHPLGVLAACKLTGTPCAWFTHINTRWLLPVISTKIPERPDYSDEIMHDALRKKTYHNGTHKSYVNLVNQKADMILVAREPSDDELKLAKQNGIEFEIHPVALDAFVFLLNNDNIVKNLSLQEIRDIYTGKITNWKQVGGADQKINAYQRNRNSGSQETMIKLVMKELKMIEPIKMIGFRAMAGPYNALSNDKNGTGFTFYYYNKEMSPYPKIKLCAIDNVLPTSESISSHEYPLVTEVFIVTLKGLAKESAPGRLRDWLLSPQGQKVVDESGYVPVN